MRDALLKGCLPLAQAFLLQPNTSHERITHQVYVLCMYVGCVFLWLRHRPCLHWSCAASVYCYLVLCVCLLLFISPLEYLLVSKTLPSAKFAMKVSGFFFFPEPCFFPYHGKVYTLTSDMFVATETSLLANKILSTTTKK